MSRSLAVLAALLLVPSIVAGQGAIPDNVLRQIDSLKSRTAELERRIDAVVAYLGQEPWRSDAASIPSTPRDIATWRRLRRGMKSSEVRQLLGEPDKVDGGTFTHWYYPSFGSITFYEDKVDEWLEPRR